MHASFSRYRIALIVALPLLLCSLSPATTMAGDSVQGTGVIRVAHGAVDGTNLFVQVAVNAYLDRNGVPQGTIAWEGFVDNELPGGNVGPGGPADPYILAVTDILVDGNTAHVTGVVIASPAGTGNANGQVITFGFRDNSGTDEPDELGAVGFFPFFPIDSGNYIVSD
jgi:hypothetical protein